MAEQQPINTQAWIIGGFNLAIVLLALAWLGGDSDSGGDRQTVELVTGDWAPYSGEHLPSYGVASAIVDQVLRHMGLQAHFSFMPWEQGEDVTSAAESSADVRATFPYARVGDRDRDFYFSLPIVNVPHSFYYNGDRISGPVLASALEQARRISQRWPADSGTLPRQTKRALQRRQEILDEQRDTELKALQEDAPLADAIRRDYRARFRNLVQVAATLSLLDARLISIRGYELPDLFAPLLADQLGRASSNIEAIRWLKERDEKLILYEASNVARTLLRDHFADDYLALFPPQAQSGELPEHANTLARLPLTITSGMHLMAGKKNPDNYRFIKHFNETLMLLKERGRLQGIEAGVHAAIVAQNAVRLTTATGTPPLRAYLAPSESAEFVILADGTPAIVLEWSAAYLQVHRTLTRPPDLIKVRIQRGPHRNKDVFIDARSIQIP